MQHDWQFSSCNPARTYVDQDRFEDMLLGLYIVMTYESCVLESPLVDEQALNI